MQESSDGEISASATESRVKLAELLYLAGYDQFKILKVIQMPKCTGILLNTVDEGGTFGPKPDDDIKLSIDGKTLAGADLKRGVTQYEYIAYSLNESKTTEEGADNKLFNLGRKIKVETFDGWATEWENVPWFAELIFDSNVSHKANGGNSEGGISSVPLPDPLPVDYYTTGPHFFEYHDNGYFYVVPPAPWRLPDWLDPGEPLTA